MPALLTPTADEIQAIGQLFGYAIGASILAIAGGFAMFLSIRKWIKRVNAGLGVDSIPAPELSLGAQLEAFRKQFAIHDSLERENTVRVKSVLAAVEDLKERANRQDGRLDRQDQRLDAFERALHARLARDRNQTK